MGDLYEELITSSLKAEDDRRATHTTQGVAIISAAGVLTTLLAGLTAVLTRTNSIPLPLASRILLAVALFLFTAAAIAALLGMSPGPYYGLDPEYLRQKVTREGWDEWTREPTRATWEIQVRRGGVLGPGPKLNNPAGRRLPKCLIHAALRRDAAVGGAALAVHHC